MTEQAGVEEVEETHGHCVDPESDVGQFLRLIATVIHDPLNTYILMAHVCGLNDSEVSALVGVNRVSIGDRKQRISESVAGCLIDQHFTLHPAVDEAKLNSLTSKRSQYYRRGQLRLANCVETQDKAQCPGDIEGSQE